MSIFQQFSNDVSAVEDLKRTIEHLCLTKAGALVSLAINQCNADYGKFGKSGKTFSQADIDVNMNVGPGDTLLAFGSLFPDGFRILTSYLVQPDRPPSDKTTSLILSKLLEFLLDTDNDHQSLKSISRSMSKCEKAVRFAEHMFSKIGISSSYTLDKTNYYPDCVKECTCGCKKNVENFYGNTSLGHPKVWHGNLDMIIREVPVSFVEKEPETLEKPTTEQNDDDGLDDPDVISQILAKNIVFSFYQKLRLPEHSNVLIPSIAVNNNEIYFTFYDSEHDVLLKSPSFPIIDENDQISGVLILATWFVLNYKVFNNEVTNELNKVKKSRFFELADCMFPIYNKQIACGGNLRSDQYSIKRYQPWFLSKCNFILPKKQKLSESC